MGFKDWFSENILDLREGGKAAPPAGQGAPGSPPAAEAGTASVSVQATGKTVAQVAREVPRPRIDPSLVRTDEKPTLSFDQVYRAAGVAVPPHSYDVFKVEALLQNERLKPLTPEARSAAVLVALDAQGVKIEEVIRDAVQRDKALDAFEQFQLRKLVELQTKVEDENKRLQQEIETFIKTRHQAIEANQQRARKFQQEIQEWRRQKGLEENRLFQVVAHFTSSNPITLSRTVSNMPPPEEPTGEVRVVPDELGQVPDLEQMGKASLDAPTAAPGTGLPPTIDLGSIASAPKDPPA